MNCKFVNTEIFVTKANLKHGDKYNYDLTNYIKTKLKVVIICKIHGNFEQKPNYHLQGNGCPKCNGRIKDTKNTFIEKAKLKHNNKYDYSLVEYIKSKIKVKIICKNENHGVFLQTPNDHITGYGCPKCAGRNKTTSDFINEAKLIHGDLYNYSLVDYKNTEKKIKIICREHGAFSQLSYSHLNGSGCPICFGTNKLTTEEFIKKAKLIHGDKYDYSNSKYINHKTKINIICPAHGEFNQKTNCHLNGSGCAKCFNSKGEQKIRMFLINNNIKFIEQYTFNDCKDINKLKFDFYLTELNVCIEYNGEQHYKFKTFFHQSKFNFESQQKRDKIKIDFCGKNNINLLILKYNEKFMNKLEDIINYKN